VDIDAYEEFYLEVRIVYSSETLKSTYCYSIRITTVLEVCNELIQKFINVTYYLAIFRIIPVVT
jgi:hypothetical protein